MLDRELFNCWDPKWAHPELLGDGYWTIDAGSDASDWEEMSAEELEAQRDVMRKPLRDVIDDPEQADYAKMEWRDYYTEHGCPEEKDAPPVHILVGTPKNRNPKRKLPVLFTVAGGGLVGGGTAELGVTSEWAFVSASGMDMVSVTFEYRTAPAHKYPATVNDCHAAYMWMLEHAEELGIHTDKIVLFGISSGGHLALSTAFRMKRYGWGGVPMPRGLVLLQPVSDDVASTDSFRFSFENPETGKSGIWDHKYCDTSFRLWLGDRFGDPTLPAEAVPNRMTLEDVKGLPPVWIPVSAEFEPSRDSVHRFATLLNQAHIFCDLHIWGGTSHGNGGIVASDFSRRVCTVTAGAIRDAMTYDFRRPWLEQG